VGTRESLLFSQFPAFFSLGSDDILSI
jgi:hypothetical protein